MNTRFFLLLAAAFALAFALSFAYSRTSPTPPFNVGTTAPAAKPSPTPAVGQMANAPAVNASLPAPDLAFLIEQGTGSELFGALFSPLFRDRWRNHLSALSRRLEAPWPKNGQSEGVARLGILKSLRTVKLEDGASARELKRFLMAFLESKAPRPWTLEREALHTLLRNGIALSEAERARITTRVDLRARNLASQSDQQILQSVLEKNRHE